MDWGLLRLHRALRDAGKTPFPRPVSPMSGTQLPKHRLSFSPAAALGAPGASVSLPNQRRKPWNVVSVHPQHLLLLRPQLIQATHLFSTLKL